MSDLLTKCSVCQALIDEEDLFCANCGTEAPAWAEKATGTTASARTATHNFTCDGCGASMSYDASAQALRCPFCGSDNLSKQADAKIMAPRRIVPFTIGQDKAVATMRGKLGQGFWRPSDLSERALVVDMKAVYVPYWVFQATSHTYWTADTNQTPRGARGDWFPLTGEHRGRYEGLLVGASGALTPGETSGLCPFELSAAVEPDQVDLDNVTVEQFSVPRKYARPLARQGIESMEVQACQQRYVPGRSRNIQVNSRIEGLSSEPLLLPVWIMAYRYKEKLYRFLVNGQTGRCTGEAPISYKKIAVVAGIVAAVLLVILLFVCAGGRAALAKPASGGRGDSEFPIPNSEFPISSSAPSHNSAMISTVLPNTRTLRPTHRSWPAKLC
ncbi:MAG: hypothetical protein IID44_04575 [Planctomycetes bacterium]|nr:hypothetical protein [Planctomycetota bacterium]